MGGFIPGSRGSFMLDLVAVAMVAILPLLALAIRSAQSGNYTLHKKVMICLSLLLLIAVIGFETEMRLIGWRHLARPSPYYDSLVFWALGVHLIFSSTATVSLAMTVWAALKRFPSPPTPGEHSEQHRRTGKLAAFSLAGTAVTGWIFYWLAFIASTA
jgi:uncharacterized membrane protein YozB (DUF420 family)